MESSCQAATDITIATLSNGKLMSYFLAVILLSFTPGPTVCGVISLAVQKNFSASALFILGILVANTVFIAFSALVKSIGFIVPYEVASFMVLIGSAGLLYLGSRMFISTLRGIGKNSHEIIQVQASNDYFFIGFFHHASNPKTVAFFLSIFLSIIPLDKDFVNNALILGLFTILIDAVILTAYSILVSLASGILFRERSLVHDLPIIASLIIIYLAISHILASYKCAILFIAS